MGFGAGKKEGNQPSVRKKKQEKGVFSLRIQPKELGREAGQALQGVQ